MKGFRIHGAFLGALLGAGLSLLIQYIQSDRNWQTLKSGPVPALVFLHELSWAMVFSSALFFTLMGFFAQRRSDELAEIQEEEAYLKSRSQK
jgi:hypothetical protein